jgi:hypothetical protein
MFRFTIRELVLLTLVVAMGVGWWIDRRRLDAPLAKLAEYQVAEKRELERQQAEKRLKDLEMQFLAAKAINEYGVPKPRSQRTAEEDKELHRAGKALMDELERRASSDLQEASPLP